VGLERSQLSLVSTIEELFEVKSSGSGLENRDYGLGIRCSDYATPLYPEKFALTWPTNGGRSGRYSSLAVSGQGVCFCFMPSASLWEGKSELNAE
jgi:hypothetical protein